MNRLSPFVLEHPKPLASAKFHDPHVTASGAVRAVVSLRQLDTLWFNTGTRCNLTCANCYIESSPTNDALAYLTVDDVRGTLDELARDRLGTRTIGFTGGEPFLNRALPEMLELALSRAHDALVLTNAMTPMRKHEAALLDLRARYGERLTLRVSLDHPTAEVHDAERGAGSFDAAVDGLVWLARSGISVAVAGRTRPGESTTDEREAYGALFARLGVPIAAHDTTRLVLFPEMDARQDVPEITEACWGILHKSPDDVMCASSRMVVKRRGANRAAVVACTLLPYDPRFELGATLAEASGPVALNHPHCAKFCVLGGASCSG